MKRALSLTLVLIVILNLCGCFFSRNGIKEPVTFYYARASSEFVYGAEDGVIASETREASGHKNDLRYLLRLYLQGPSDQNLQSPFPAGTGLLLAEAQDGTLTVTLSSAFTKLKDLDLSIACACLAQTCFGLTDTEEVVILAEAAEGSDTIHVTISKDSFLLEDNILPSTEASD